MEGPLLDCLDRISSWWFPNVPPQLPKLYNYTSAGNNLITLMTQWRTVCLSVEEHESLHFNDALLVEISCIDCSQKRTFKVSVRQGLNDSLQGALLVPPKTTRRCYRCKTVKDISMFVSIGIRKGWLCKQCDAERHRQKRQKKKAGESSSPAFSPTEPHSSAASHTELCKEQTKVRPEVTQPTITEQEGHQPFSSSQAEQGSCPQNGPQEPGESEKPST